MSLPRQLLFSICLTMLVAGCDTFSGGGSSPALDTGNSYSWDTDSAVDYGSAPRDASTTSSDQYLWPDARNDTLTHQLWCSSAVTRQGQVCITCNAPNAPQSISCTEGAPTDASTCHDLVVAGNSCEVCHGEDGYITSQECTPQEQCTTTRQGGQVCLVCTKEGREVFSACEQASIDCSVKTTATTTCLECIDSSGNMVSNECVETTRDCQVEALNGVSCLVCRDGAGGQVSAECANAG